MFPSPSRRTPSRSLARALACLAVLLSAVPAQAITKKEAKARVQEMLGYINSEIHKSYSPLFNDKTPAEVRTEKLETLAKRYGLIEKQLSGRDYLFWEFSAADCAAFPFVKYGLVHDEADTDEFHLILQLYLALNGRCPRVEAWIRRVDERPRA